MNFNPNPFASRSPMVDLPTPDMPTSAIGRTPRAGAIWLASGDLAISDILDFSPTRIPNAAAALHL
ncbi:hypothetical protein ACFFNA_40325, partial [Mesorhizobium kowhaii]